ncbi:MAG: ribonuclease HIII [Firmicutes bacterium]|nr:ribonuclease HIII [Bacillota bacterium]
MTITLKVSENTKEKMIEYFEDKKREKTPPYAVFQADDADTVVTLYNSGKAVFQGVSADIDARMWKEMEQHLNPTKQVEMTNSDKKEKKEKKEIYIDPKIYYSSAIGSDEVGTGDYFGPIVVTSAYVSKENIAKLEELGVKDSKKLNDQKIMEIVPEIIKFIPYNSIILTNKEYNERYSDDINMNKIKALLHNRALNNLKSQGYEYDYIIVDEFAKPYVYYNYLKTSSNVCRNITFLTKGEDKSLAVACASLISRYIFLKEFDKMGESMGVFLPKGASDTVDQMGVKIAKKYGIDKLSEVAKLNFKNTAKIKYLLEEKES